jgi:hypothetical protein
MNVLRAASAWLIVVALAGCHGIEHTPTGPSAPARSTVPVRLTVIASPGELPVGGGSAALIIEALGSDGGGVASTVTLEVTGGELGADHVTTDGTGHASASWAGTSSTTLTARAGELIAVSTIRVLQPAKLPPPSVPPPPTPTPEPTPLPTPTPALSVTLTAAPASIPVGGSTTLSASVSNLQPGEVVTAYQWDYEGDKTVNDTTLAASRTHVYPDPDGGIISPTVRVLTSSNRSATGTGQVVVFKLLR